MSLKGRGGREVILLKYCSEDILLSSVKKIHFLLLLLKTFSQFTNLLYKL